MIFKSPIISPRSRVVKGNYVLSIQRSRVTFCKGSRSFPRATMATITIPAEMMPAT
jgi:hypothetical protein